MPYPIQITFRGVPSSTSLKEQLIGEAEQLEHYFDGILGCRVLLEAPHRHHRKGRLYRVRIDVAVPGKKLVVTRNPSALHDHEDAYVTARDSFEEARRLLRDYVMRLRGHVKSHDVLRIEYETAFDEKQATEIAVA